MPARAFPPSSLARAHHAALRELLADLLPERDLRANPRVIKRKMPRWHVKRAHHYRWPQPTTAADQRITIVRP